MDILDILKISSKECPATREKLVLLSGHGDRKCRREIQSLRKEGYPIVSDSNSKGYYLATDKNELLSLIRQNQSRIKSLTEVNEWLMARVTNGEN